MWYYLTFASVIGQVYCLFLNGITVWLSALTFHQTIYFQTADSTTDIIKHCHIQVNLFYIKLSALLVALTIGIYFESVTNLHA